MRCGKTSKRALIFGDRRRLAKRATPAWIIDVPLGTAEFVIHLKTAKALGRGVASSVASKGYKT
jgi:hypothetical protein